MSTKAHRVDYPRYPLPLSEADTEQLVLLYARHHREFTEKEVVAFIRSYVEAEVARATFLLAAEGTVSTHQDADGTVIFVRTATTE